MKFPMLIAWIMRIQSAMEIRIANFLTVGDSDVFRRWTLCGGRQNDTVDHVNDAI
jgi:hypothetical protein